MSGRDAMNWVFRFALAGILGLAMCRFGHTDETPPFSQADPAASESSRSSSLILYRHIHDGTDSAFLRTILPETDSAWNVGALGREWAIGYFDSIVASTMTASSATITAATITTLTGTTISETTATITNIVTSSVGTNQVAYNNGTKLVGSSRITTTDGATLAVDSMTINGLLYGGNPVGTVVMYVSSTSTPSGWLNCDGSSKSTTTYSRLFATIGYTFGGSGANFSLPDFQGVFPKGQGTTARAAGKDSSGNFYAGTIGTYSTDKMQGHFHQIPTTASPLGATLAADRGSALGTPDLSSAGPITDGTNGTPRTGHTTEPQSLGINFIIYAGI